MISRASYLLLGCIFTLVGCKHSQPTMTYKAHLANTSPAVKKQLQDAIVQLKGGVAPQLADNVFMRSSTLILEQGMNQHGYEPILGQHDISVTRFELLMKDGLCVLYYPKKDKYLNLTDLQCNVQPSTEK
ncbi:hypothetical protein PA25_01000 [Pseudoalteromonas sp. A25]|uniref:hypothetical protein n=1 Tax=Pseudoalteromonas sp. A25 TaxID=116092 RepID=UPI0012609789|nr:hypothetical protein [Pseudoalteromonas sp. A25]BBN80115.1 hypothetical protein PA25_01000 [Pseudoalteromonas sp. A25]